MKLVLMALVIEISLVRIFAGSWGLAMLLVLIYCIIVYIVVRGRGSLMKKRTKSKTKIGFGYTMYPDLGALSKN
ncbi:MAG: hypothetical protein H0V14_08835 [Chitinophagaceae bacterium]|jgi:TRAP-type C4-dicarboxylate transport system permease large subunit|nr:hypothetical protein [Chitinophagaceae bacterium]